MYKREGFTAIELVVVIVVIGILLSIGIISYRSTQASTRDRARAADVAALQVYLEAAYPKEIKNSSGVVVKQAGSYPVLPQEITDTAEDLEVIFADLDWRVMTAPDQATKRITPDLPPSGDYFPSQPAASSSCGSYYYRCYTRPNDIVGYTNRYIYAPGPSSNELCTSENARVLSGAVMDSGKCRMYSIIYRTEVGNQRVVVESKRR